MNNDITINYPPVDVRTEAFIDAVTSGTTALDTESLDELPFITMVTEDDGEPFTGRVIGFGSSYRGDTHRHHSPGTPPPKGKSCSKCRWTDTFIVRVETDAKPQYVFLSYGKSALPGETTRETVVWTEDPTAVLRTAFVPTKPEFVHDTGYKAVPPHNGAALREAARVDEAFAELLSKYAEVIPDPTQRGADADPLAGL